LLGQPAHILAAERRGLGSEGDRSDSAGRG
jgi:hypothetical protein